MPFSIVIIAKNEEANIVRLLQSVTALSDDIIVYDSGSVDATVKLAKQAGASVIEAEWLGYGRTKNIANSIAKHEWILSLDADEMPDQTLQGALQDLKPGSNNTVFVLKRNTVFQGKKIRFGVCFSERKERLFNKQIFTWNEALVHEQLKSAVPNYQIKKLPGCLLHYSYSNVSDAKEKLQKYAGLMAQEKYKAGRRSALWKAYFAACFDWIKNCIFKLGFLDGAAGITLCRLNAQYVYLKYKKLFDLEQHD